MGQEIKTIRLELPLKFGSVNCFLVNTSAGFVLVDAGGANNRRELEKEIEAAGCGAGDLKLIVLTHGDFDHSGNAAYLRRKYGAKIVMHPVDAGVVERSDIFWNRKKGYFLMRKVIAFVLGFGKSERFIPDVLVEDSTDLSDYGFGARVVHIPGHSPGSIGLLTAQGDFFCGDLIVNPGVPSPTTIVDDPDALKASLEKLVSMNIHTVYPGHGKPFVWGEFVMSYEDDLVNRKKDAKIM